MARKKGGHLGCVRVRPERSGPGSSSARGTGTKVVEPPVSFPTRPRRMRETVSSAYFTTTLIGDTSVDAASCVASPANVT